MYTENEDMNYSTAVAVAVQDRGGYSSGNYGSDSRQLLCFSWELGVLLK